MSRWYNYTRREKVADDANGTHPAWWLFHRSLAKSNKRNPYLIANEWIAANIGWFLRLPIPPFALMRHSEGSQRLFASLDYGGRDVQPEDTDADTLLQSLSNACAEVLLFDIFIANPDRHEGNLKVDNATKPTQIEVIDHDCALFGNKKGKGQERLGGLLGTDSLGLWPGIHGKTSPLHKLIGSLRSAESMPETAQRISGIPDWFIERVCSECEGLGPTSAEIELVSRFLRDRKHRVLDIVKNNKQWFTSVQSWPLLLAQ